MTEVLRIALPNKDVENGHIGEMVLDSRYPNPKIDTLANPPHAGTIFLDWNDTTGLPDGTIKLIDSFPHNYTKLPTVFASYKFDNGSNILKGVLPFQNGSLGVLVIDSDDKNINLKYYSTDQGSPATAITPFIMQLRFYVMAEHGIDPE